MVFTTQASSSSSSSSSRVWEYDAFLSFRGEDIRKSFISHLYNGLRQQGIITFKDDPELETAQSISESLPKAIAESRILIIIFSKTYASSTWCLNELVQILECKKAGRHTVLPIFYDVTPSQVRKQSGDFGEAFAVSENRFKDNTEKLKQWRDAMAEAADLKGWELQDRDESEFIHEIVKDIIRKLGLFSYDIPKGIVGMGLRLEKMRSYLNMGQADEVKIIGVWGMGGIGKTTIASVVYKQIYSQFDGSSFLADVREASKRYDGLVSLQNKLLSAILNRDLQVYDIHRGMDEIRKRLCQKKVLVILDDVDELQQLECLIGNRDENWFGVGSRIIITTRNKHLLVQHGVDYAYMLEELDYHEALELFFFKAFKNECPAKDYVELSDQFLRYASGLPLALNVLGSYLFAKSIREWKSALDRLKQIPNEEILRKLQISFDGLDEVDKKIFLDIACFFNGVDENYVKKILESCGFYPENGMRELINKSLITISDGTVWMHDIFREMGQEIVRRESSVEPGQRSRIWLYEDVYQVLMNDAGSEKIEAICLDLCDKRGQLIKAKGFTKMKYLRLLILQNAHIFHGLEYLSNELRYLEWHQYPFRSFPLTFQPNKLVELHLPHSNVEKLWKPIKPAESMKVINLSFSNKLIKTPDLTEFPNLEELNLQGCTRLLEVHQSIGVSKRLVSLNLQNCKNLEILPSGIWNLQSLKIITLRGCSKLSNWLGFGTRQMPSMLPTWLLADNKNQNIPQALGLPTLPFLKNLKNLNLSYCNLLEGAIPNDLSCFPLLENLNLSGNPLLSIPSSICQLSKLKGLDLSGCTELKTLTDLPSNIERLSTGNCTSLRTLPDLVQLCRLEDLLCTNCESLQSVPDLPSNVQHLNMENCTSLRTLPDLVQLCRLENLLCTNCESLQSVPDLPSNVQHLNMGNCTALETLPNLFEKHNVEKNFYISFSNCSKLNYCQGKISVAFQWLRSYLLWLYEIRQRLKLQRDMHSDLWLPWFNICFPGSGIPEWFKYQGEESGLRIKLPPDEDWWKIAGFAVCCVVEDGNVGENINWRIEVYNRSMRVYCPSNHVPIPGSSRVISNHCSLFFQVNDLLDPNKECSPTELLLSFEPEGKIKNCGIRVVHDDEIEEMIRLNKALEDLGEDEEEE